MTSSTTTVRARFCLPTIVVLLLTIPALTGGDWQLPIPALTGGDSLLAPLALAGGDALAQPPSLATSETLSAAADTARVVPPPVCGVQAADAPDDGGGVIQVTWEVSDDAPGAELVTGYEIFRYAPGETLTSVGVALLTDSEFEDASAEDGTTYQYVIRTLTAAGTADSEPSGAVMSSAQWFAVGRFPVLVVTVLFCAFVLLFIQLAKKGSELFIRKIPGLEAVDEAVGRATEMGRPVLYVPGIETVSEVGTLAALTILGHVA